MSYQKVANNIISNTNFTQQEIADKCKELNAPISRVQLNKVLNGKAPAPEEKVSRAIAKICNADDRELVIEGYLEKAPKEFIEFINIFQNLSIEATLRFMEGKYTNESIHIIRDLYKKQTLAKVIVETLNINNMQLLETLNMNTDGYSKNDFENMNYINMEDDSMQEKIPKGSKLKLKMKEKYKNGDIVLVKLKDNKKPIIRLVCFIGRDIFLYALNKEYSSLYLKNGEYKIIAEIESIEIKI